MTVRKIPWSRKWQPIPVFLPRGPHRLRTWQATVHRVAKSQTSLSNCTTGESPSDFNYKISTIRHSGRDKTGVREKISSYQGLEERERRRVGAQRVSGQQHHVV